MCSYWPKGRVVDPLSSSRQGFSISSMVSDLGKGKGTQSLQRTNMNYSMLVLSVNSHVGIIFSLKLH